LTVLTVVVRPRSDEKEPKLDSGSVVASEDAMSMSDFAECIITREDTKRKLEALERSLGEALGIATSVRRELIARDQRGELEWSPELAEWQEAYASFKDWIKAEAGEGDEHGESVLHDKPPPRKEKAPSSAKEAACAASSLLWVSRSRCSNRVPPECHSIPSRRSFSIASFLGSLRLCAR
jgi:hypothetical protein